MRQVIALAWKEWREVRWVLAVAAVAYVALPLIGGIESWWTYHQFGYAPSLWVTWSGGILGTLAGAFAAARDLNGPVAEFFQSRAIGVGRRWLVKYAVGLAALWVACLVPLAIEVWTELKGHSWSYALDHRVIWFAPLWAVQYSLGFVCGSLTRRTGPAVMLAFALTLLFYFLPLILPPLQTFSVADAVDNDRPDRRPLVIGAIAMSLVSLAIATFFVWMNWRVRAGRGLMYWSIAIGVLLLFGSAAFQIASNLPILQEIALGDHESILSIDSDGHRGMVATWRISPPVQTATLRSIDITSSGVSLGEAVSLPWVSGRDLRSRTAAVWLPAHPDVCFTLRERREVGPRRVELDVVSLRSVNGLNPVATLDLGTGYDPRDPDLPNWQWSTSRLFGAGNELLARWWYDGSTKEHTAGIDVSDPMHPRRTLSDPPRWRGTAPLGYWHESDYPQQWDVGLPPLPGASDRERLQIAVRMSLELDGALADRNLIARWHDGVILYRLDRLTNAPVTILRGGDAPPVELPHGSADFQKVGGRAFSFLERFLYPDGGAEQIAAGDGHAYLSMRSQSFGRPMSRVTVLDIRDPSRPRPVAHFATSDHGPFVVQPLPDGRALIGGDKLYVVGPPPGHARS